MKPPIYDPAWPEDLRALYRHDVQEIWDRSVAPQVWSQYQNQLDYYLRIAGNEGRSILDVGCAQGTLALMLAERGHRVAAVDIRPQFLEYAASRFTHGDVRFLAGNILEMDIDGQFDLVFANQLIEHLVYPGLLLARLRNLLRDGGRLVVTTPNGGYLMNRLRSYAELGDPEQWEERQFTADGDGHFFAYTEGELRALFSEGGLRDIQLLPFETPWVSGHMRVRYLHRVLPYHLLRALDRALLSLPWFGKRFAHQLLATGIR